MDLVSGGGDDAFSGAVLTESTPSFSPKKQQKRLAGACCGFCSEAGPAAAAGGRILEEFNDAPTSSSQHHVSRKERRRKEKQRALPPTFPLSDSEAHLKLHQIKAKKAIRTAARQVAAVKSIAYATPGLRSISGQQQNAVPVQSPLSPDIKIDSPPPGSLGSHLENAVRDLNIRPYAPTYLHRAGADAHEHQFVAREDFIRHGQNTYQSEDYSHLALASTQQQQLENTNASSYQSLRYVDRGGPESLLQTVRSQVRAGPDGQVAPLPVDPQSQHVSGQIGDVVSTTYVTETYDGQRIEVGSLEAALTARRGALEAPDLQGQQQDNSSRPTDSVPPLSGSSQNSLPAQSSPDYLSAPVAMSSSVTQSCLSGEGHTLIPLENGIAMFARPIDAKDAFVGSSKVDQERRERIVQNYARIEELERQIYGVNRNFVIDFGESGASENLMALLETEARKLEEQDRTTFHRAPYDPSMCQPVCERIRQMEQAIYGASRDFLLSPTSLNQNFMQLLAEEEFKLEQAVEPGAIPVQLPTDNLASRESNDLAATSWTSHSPASLLPVVGSGEESPAVSRQSNDIDFAKLAPKSADYFAQKAQSMTSDALIAIRQHDQFVADQRAADQRVADQRAADQRAADQRVADQRVADQRAADQRVADQRAAEERAIDDQRAAAAGADSSLELQPDLVRVQQYYYNQEVAGKPESSSATQTTQFATLADPSTYYNMRSPQRVEPENTTYQSYNQQPNPSNLYDSLQFEVTSHGRDSGAAAAAHPVALAQPSLSQINQPLPQSRGVGELQMVGSQPIIGQPQVAQEEPVGGPLPSQTYEQKYANQQPPVATSGQSTTVRQSQQVNPKPQTLRQPEQTAPRTTHQISSASTTGRQQQQFDGEKKIPQSGGGGVSGDGGSRYPSFAFNEQNNAKFAQNNAPSSSAIKIASQIAADSAILGSQSRLVAELPRPAITSSSTYGQQIENVLQPTTTTTTGVSSGTAGSAQQQQVGYDPAIYSVSQRWTDALLSSGAAAAPRTEQILEPQISASIPPISAPTSKAAAATDGAWQDSLLNNAASHQARSKLIDGGASMIQPQQQYKSSGFTTTTSFTTQQQQPSQQQSSSQRFGDEEYSQDVNLAIKSSSIDHISNKQQSYSATSSATSQQYNASSIYQQQQLVPINSSAVSAHAKSVSDNNDLLHTTSVADVQQQQQQLEQVKSYTKTVTSSSAVMTRPDFEERVETAAGSKAVTTTTVSTTTAAAAAPPLQLNAEMSLSEQFGAENVGRDEFGEYLIRRVEVPLKETVQREQRKVERRETLIEKKVPVIQESVKRVEVKDTQYNTVYKEVDKIVYRDVTKTVDRHEDKPYDVTEIVKVPVEVVKYVDVEIPGEIIEVPKYYVVNQDVIVPRFEDKRQPVIVAQSFYPIIVEAEDSDEVTVDVDCKIVSFTVQYQDVYVPVAVYRPALFESMVTQHKEVPLSAIPEGQYNALIKDLNPNLDFKASAELFQYHQGVQNSALGALFQTDRGPLYKQSGPGCSNVVMKDDRTVICTLHKNTLQPEQLIEQHAQHLLPNHTSGFAANTTTTTTTTTTSGMGMGLGNTAMLSGGGTAFSMGGGAFSAGGSTFATGGPTFATLSGGVGIGSATTSGINMPTLGSGINMSGGLTLGSTGGTNVIGSENTNNIQQHASGMTGGGSGGLASTANDENYFASSTAMKTTTTTTTTNSATTNSALMKNMVMNNNNASADAAFFSTPTTPEKQPAASSDADQAAGSYKPFGAF